MSKCSDEDINLTPAELLETVAIPLLFAVWIRHSCIRAAWGPQLEYQYYNNMAEIDLEFLQNLLAEEYPDVEIQEFEGAPGSKRGDNYTSMVYRITLTGVRRVKRIDDDSVDDLKEPWEGSIIYKVLPDSTVMREAYKSDELFCNEVAFYTKIWPEFSAFQSQWKKVKTPFKAIPKCYLAQNDMVILKDLKQEGFVMPDRRQGLNIQQAYFVLKHLSHFHALSLAMKNENPERFHELLNCQDGITEVFFLSDNEDYYKGYYMAAMRNAITMVEEELAGNENRDLYLDKFRSFCEEESFFQTMVDLVQPKEPLAVITHGDCWTNNMLFKYVDGDIAELYFVDFQLVRYASPALDLVFLVYLCLNRQQRAEHLSSLLDYYTDHLHQTLLDMTEENSIFHSSLKRDALFDHQFTTLLVNGCFLSVHPWSPPLHTYYTDRLHQTLLDMTHEDSIFHTIVL